MSSTCTPHCCKTRRTRVWYGRWAATAAGAGGAVPLCGGSAGGSALGWLIGVRVSRHGTGRAEQLQARHRAAGWRRVRAALAGPGGSSADRLEPVERGEVRGRLLRGAQTRRSSGKGARRLEETRRSVRDPAAPGESCWTAAGGGGSGQEPADLDK